MKHDRFEPLVEAICYMYDYGSDSHMKAQELLNILRPLGSQVDNKSALEASYGILHYTLEIIGELECMNAIDVENKLKVSQDLRAIKKLA